MNQAGKQAKAKGDTYPSHISILRPINEKPPEGGLSGFWLQDRNRTTDTRILKYPPIDRFRFDFKDLSHHF